MSIGIGFVCVRNVCIWVWFMRDWPDLIDYRRVYTKSQNKSVLSTWYTTATVDEDAKMTRWMKVTTGLWV